MQPEQEPPRSDTAAAPPTPQPLGPSPEVREVLYRAVALGLVIVIGVVILIIAAVSLGSGILAALSAGTAPAPLPSPPVTAVVATTVPLPPATAAVEFLPPGSEVFVVIEPKSPAGVVTVRFDGGPGRAQVKEIEVRLTGSDSIVATGSLDPQTVSPQIFLQGTRGTDRIEVFAKTYSGKTYKIIDQQMPYQQRF